MFVVKFEHSSIRAHDALNENYDTLSFPAAGFSCVG